MNLETMIGQRFLHSFHGTELPAAFTARLRARQIGGVTLFRSLNVASPAQVRALTAELQAAAQASGQPPLLICADQEGGQLLAIGGTTPFPGNMALGATGSDELARRTGQALGRELAALGVNVNYAPVCDVNINPHNPVIGVRSFGESPALVARLAAAFIEGMQAAGVAATAKHFPGHGDTASDTHHGLASLPHDRARLEAVELVPFRAAVAAGTRLVMTAHLALPALATRPEAEPTPATLAPEVLRGLLRGELGFAGLIVSDAMEMRAIGQGNALIVDTLVAASAGVDLLLLGSGNDQDAPYEGLLQAARRGLLPQAELLAAAERVLALKHWLAAQPQPALAVIGSAEHQALAAETAARAITLVRDTAGLLPLRLPADARLAVVVPQTADLTPADTSSYERCDLAGAVRRYHPRTDGFSVSANPTGAEIAALRDQLVGYDLLIVATINAMAQPGQAALVRELLASGLPMVVAALRLPYDLAEFAEVGTFVCSYSVLQPAINALAGALWGQAAISGRLPVSIPGLYPAGHGQAVDFRL